MSFATSNGGIPNFMQTPAQAQPDSTPLKRVEVAECFNPEYIPADQAQQYPALNSVRNAMAENFKRFNTLNERRITPDRRLTETANRLEIARLAEGVEKGVHERLKNARSTLNTGIAQARTEVDTAANLKADEYASEIRAAFKAMKPGERAEALTAAVEAEDRQTLAAILNAPTITTGVPDDLRAALKEQFFRKVAPAQMAKLDAHLTADRRLRACEDIGVTQATRFFEGTENYNDKLKVLEAINGTLADEE